MREGNITYLVKGHLDTSLKVSMTCLCEKSRSVSRRWHQVAIIARLLQGYTANTRHSTNAGLMLAQHLRRWTNIKPTLVQRLVLTGYSP